MIGDDEARARATIAADCVALTGTLDREIARVKLSTMGVAIDVPTSDQLRYMTSWEEGT